MRIAREYIVYLSRVLTHKLVQDEMVSTPNPPAMTDAIHQALTDEFGVEDRINDEARAILSAHAEDMSRLGAGYGDSFKKIKAELVRKHKVVL